MKKILITALFIPVFSYGNVYVGGKTGASMIKTGASITNPSDFIGYADPIKLNLNSISANKNTNAFLLSVFGGYSFKEYSVFKPFAEFDYEYSNVDVKSDQLSFAPQVLINDVLNANDMQNEHVNIQMNHSFGVSFGSKIKVVNKVSALFSLRFNASLYKVNAYHLNVDGITIIPANNRTENNWIFGVEPTVGGEYDLSERLSFRLTFSHNIQQSKQMMNTYINDTNYISDGIEGGVKIEPSAFNVRASVIYNF